jgi:hypothetical protein
MAAPVETKPKAELIARFNPAPAILDLPMA